jgi:hypothetical protein
MAKATATARKLAKSTSANVPKGMRTLSSDYAPSWDPEKVPTLEGAFGEVRTVPLKQDGKRVERRCSEMTLKDGKRVTVWESAGLKRLFDEASAGATVYIHFDGYGEAKPGQNAPKLFTVGIDD